MKSEELSDLEIFKMAVAMASSSLAADQRLATTVNPEDIMMDRIKDCHSVIQAAALEILGKPPGQAH